MADEIDFCISVGGDGTLLHLNSLFQNKVPPVLAFSAGTLGFLINFLQTEIDSVVNQFIASKAKFHLSERARLRCSVFRNGERREIYTVLNEVTIERGEFLLPIAIEIYINNKFLTKTKADGVIISTPTGSTAYSMSAGGSMVSPSVSAILVTPICPHTLSFRPLIIPDNFTVKIRIPKNDNLLKACVTFDGQKREDIMPLDELEIALSSHRFPLIKRQSDDHYWFESLRNKLFWNNDG